MFDGLREGRIDSIGRRRRARREIRRAHGYELNLDWYRVRYQIAALSLNRATASLDGDGEALGSPDSLVQQALAETAAVARLAVDAIERFAAAELDLASLLRTTIAPSALVLHAGSLIQSGGVAKVSRGEGAPPLVDWIAVRVALEHPDPWQLVAFVEARTDLAPSVYYNLACFRIRADLPREAVPLLLTAIHRTPTMERRALFNLIDDDVTLAPLRRNEELIGPVLALRPDERETGSRER